jgi:hypothetical protein
MISNLRKAALARMSGRTRPASELPPAGPSRTRELQIAAVALGALTRPSGW